MTWQMGVAQRGSFGAIQIKKAKDELDQQRSLLSEARYSVETVK